MSDQKDKIFVRHSIDTGLASLEGNPFLAQRIMNQERTEKPVMKKKISFAFVLAMILVLACMVTALAAAFNEEFNTWLYNRWPEAALKLMPVDLSCENEGIRMEVTSASVLDSELLISYTMEDLEGDRLRLNDEPDEEGWTYSYAIYPQVFCGPTEVEIHTGADTYNEEDHKFYGAEYVRYTSDIVDPHNEAITLIMEFPTSQVSRNVDLYEYLKEYGDRVQMTSVPEKAKVHRFGADDPGDVPFAESGLPATMQVIDGSTGPEIFLEDSLYLSGIKLVDGWMHIQFHYPDHWLNVVQTEDGYRYEDSAPYEIWMFPDREEDDPYADVPVYENMYFLSWGTVPHSGTSLPEYEEIIFRVDPETVEKAASVPVMIEKYVERIPGQWKVEIPLRLIRNAK